MGDNLTLHQSRVIDSFPENTKAESERKEIEEEEKYGEIKIEEEHYEIKIEDEEKYGEIKIEEEYDEIKIEVEYSNVGKEEYEDADSVSCGNAVKNEELVTNADRGNNPFVVASSENTKAESEIKIEVEYENVVKEGYKDEDSVSFGNAIKSEEEPVTNAEGYTDLLIDASPENTKAELEIKIEEEYDNFEKEEYEGEDSVSCGNAVNSKEPVTNAEEANNPFGLIKMVDGHIVYECDVCLKNFDKRCMIMRHRRMHTGEKPHKCHVCDKEFSDRSNYNKHVRTHVEAPIPSTKEGKKEYECNRCKKFYATLFNLKRHLRTHAAKGEPSTDEQNLQQSLTHGIEKAQAPCEKCGQVFINSSRLTQHQESGCYYTALKVLRMSQQLGVKKNTKRK